MKADRMIIATVSTTAHAADQLKFHGAHVRLAEVAAFAAFLEPLRKTV